MSTSKSDFVSRKNKQDTFVSDDSGNFTASVFTDGDGSHVTLLSPRVDPAASVGGITEDGCYTSAVSLSDYLTAPSSPRNSAEPAESYLKAIFDNFNELYQDKMAWIDENIPDIDSHSHVMAKKNVLEHWVKDVIEQNNILVQTVEELETEAEKKVQVLQKKVYESAELAKEHMGMIKEYEDQIKQLMKEKHIVEKQEEFFRKESMYLEKEKRRALDRMHTLENDNSSLITLMNRIRDMGVWDTNGLNFTPRTYDCIFGLYPNLAGSEVQTVFTREKTRHLEKAENNIAQLMAQVEELHGRKNEAEKLLTEKTKVTEELQNDIKDLHIKIKQYQDEHQDFKRSLKETQEQLKAATLKNVQSRPSTGDTKRESEMKEMLGELRDLRNQLNIACTERQQAMKESNQLKTELKGRIVQMEDMKCLLDQIQTEAASTRNAVQDVQDKQGQMSSLKEEVSFYQTSYENSNVLLEAKSEIITRLQNQMDQLHDKVAKLEKSRSCSPNPVATTSTPPSRSPSLPASHPYSHRPSHPESRSRPASASHPSCHDHDHENENDSPQTIAAALSSGKKPKPKEIRKAAVKVNKKGSITTKPSKTETSKLLDPTKKHSSSYYSKPPWNENFVRNKKLSSPRTSSDKQKSQSHNITSAPKYSSEAKTASSVKTTIQMHKNESSPPPRLSSFEPDKADEKRLLFNEPPKLHSMSTGNENSHAPVNRIIADYIGQSDASGKNSSVNDSKKTSKQQNQRTLERIKLPPIPTKVETLSPPLFEKTLEEHLPRIIVKEKKHHSSGIETLENLMEVCVKASRELNRQSDAEGKSSQKYRVVAGHTHRRHTYRSRENTYTVETVPKSKAGGKGEREVSTPKTTMFMSRTADDSKPQHNNNSNNINSKNSNNNSTVNKNKLNGKPKPVVPETESETISNISQFRRAPNPQPQKSTPPTPFPDERSPASILAELPKEANDYLVKKWIVSSPSPSKKIRKPRSTSPNKSVSNVHSLSDPYRPDSRGKSKSTGPANLKMLAFDEWSRKQDVTHSDATGDRDSGHLSDFSDCWNWNGNEDEDKEIQMQQTAADMISTGCENYETICSSASEHSQSHIGPDLDRFQQLLIENQRLIEEKQELEELNKHLERDKSQTNDDHKKELELKDVEITMQKGLMVSNDQPLHLHQGHQKVNNPDSDAVVAVGGKIRHARQSCASLQDKVMDASRELTCIKNLTEKLHVKSKMLEKHDLLHKSYVLLGQIERDHNYYLEGIDGSLDRDEGDDYLDSITTTTVRIPVPVPAGSTQDADAEPQGAHSHSEQPFNDESSANIDFNWKNSYHMELRQISEFAVAVNAQVTDKFTLVEYLKQETEEMQRVVQLLSKSVEDLVVKGNTENVKLIEKIEKLERKQAQTDEVLRMESEIHGMHTEIQEYDAGVLLTEKRLGVIQNSYDKLSHELIRRDELISQRDAKIAELESYIKESDILNQSNSMHSTSNSFSEHFEFEHSVVVPNENSNSSFLHQSSDVEKIGKLIWLVSALKKKLKKKKDREDSVRKEKEILMNLVSNMSSTWNGLRAGCDQVRLENELLKTKLETQSQNVIMHSPRKMLPSVVHPHSLQSSSSRHWSHQEEGDGDKSGYELTTQSQVQAMQITPRSQIENNNSNNSSGSGIGRIVYPLRSHTDCSLKFPQSSSPHSKGLSDSDILHQQQHPTTSAKAPGNRGILTVTPRNTNTNTNNSANLHFPFQISSMGSLNTNQFKDDELYGISSIPPTATAPQSHNLSPSSPIFLTESDKDKSLDISFISPPKCIGLESSHESRVQMCPIPIPNFTFPPTYSPSLHQSQRQPQQPVYHEPRTQDRHDVNEAEPSSELQDLVRLWEECHARTRQVLNLGHLSVPSHTSDSSFQRSENE